MKIAVVLLVLSLSLGACGQQGPLYLPQPNKPQPSAPPAEPEQRAPAQPQADQQATPAQ